MIRREFVGIKTGFELAARVLLDPSAQQVGGDVELSARLGMGVFLFGNDLDDFSLKFGGEYASRLVLTS